MCLLGHVWQCLIRSGESQTTTGTTIQCQLGARMAGTEGEPNAKQLGIISHPLTIFLPEVLRFPRRSALSYTITMVDVAHLNLVPSRNLEPPNGANMSLPPPHPDPCSVLKRLFVCACTGLTPPTQCLCFGGFPFTTQKIGPEFGEHLYLAARQGGSQR
jgi:hypothetical protein